MINKAMIEIPPRFAGQKPIGPIPKGEQEPDAFADWSGAKGLAEDVRRYGHWMREEAFKRIGHLYPTIPAVQEKDSTWRHATADDAKDKQSELTVIAWLWARTVKSPNPAYSHVDVPLTANFLLSGTRRNKPQAWLKPVVEGDNYRFEVHHGNPPAEAKNGTKGGRGAHFKCILSDTAINPEYIKQEGSAGAWEKNSWLLFVRVRAVAFICREIHKLSRSLLKFQSHGSGSPNA